MTLLFQNMPIILLFVVAAVLLNRFGSFTPVQTIVMAILVIGISNGANAAEAMRDALLSRPEPTAESLKSIFSVTFIQVRNCLINAAKGTPLASFVGTPELLSVMINITAFTGTRTSTYVFMAVFYLLTGDRLFIVFFVTLFFVSFVLLSRWAMIYIVKIRLRLAQ